MRAMSESPWLLSAAKRSVDVVVAIVSLVLATPIIAGTALIVRLRLGSPVLFRQQRAGLHGVPFELIKFRTMSTVTGPDDQLLDDDQRLSAFGTRLRASSLDELPQLLCVLRGDMSVIGPRPLLLQYSSRYSAEQRRRLLARPGLTGWAQVKGRNAVNWSDKLALDVDYVDRASALRDLQILLRTPSAVLSRRGITDGQSATSAEFVGDQAGVVDESTG